LGELSILAEKQVNDKTKIFAFGLKTTGRMNVNMTTT
jgi:hypothetical protein